MNRNEDLSDRELWAKILQNDTLAFEQVVLRYQNRVAAIAYSILGDFAVSQEVTQETFWQAWRSRAQLQEPGLLSAWLCGIVRNLARQALRMGGRDLVVPFVEETVDWSNDPALKTISVEEREMIWGALEAIPEIYRETLVLFYREEHSVAEVAAALEISEDAVKQRLSRGRSMLREHLADKVEEVLVRSRPGRALTTRIMAGISAMTIAFNAAGKATASTIASSVAKGAASGVAATAAKSTMAGAGAGILGGAAGAAGGLLGAWLGTTIPARMAPTMAERRLIENQGRKSMAASVLFMVLLLAACSLVFLKAPIAWFIGTVAVLSVVFAAYIIGTTFRLNRRVLEVRKSMHPEDDPNLLRPKSLSHLRYRGRCYTSKLRILGVPVLDVQFSTPGQDPKSSSIRSAFGWIALGDRATGLLLAIGGVARGLVAMGGLAIGGVAVGGLSLGLFALGGMAIGGLAIGGGAIGYDSAGGAAAGWHSAAGGGALAWHVAAGGGALAHDFAIGGGAWAAEVNTEAAREVAANESMYWLLEWQNKHQLAFFAGVFVISFLPMLLMPLCYRRIPGRAKP